jgi:hypothetical protein
MKRTFLLLLSGFIAAAGMAAPAAAAPVSGKPQIPLQVRIEPASPAMKQKAIHPGEVVELTVTALSPAEDAEMRVEIELLDGAELVAGDLVWQGVLGRRGKKRMPLSVRTPRSGTGKVRASVFFLKDGGQQAVRVSLYLLGSSPSAAAGNAVGRPAAADSRGRAVQEYR